MGGKVIDTLRSSPTLSVFGENELRSLAGCGCLEEYPAGATILEPDRDDARMFVLREGRIALHICMFTGGRCGGEASFEWAARGQVLGWQAWVQSDRISVAAHAVEAVSVVALDLRRLREPLILANVRQRMLQNLYGLLQEGGVCPPNIQLLLRLGEDVSIQI